ncbi:diguanylate cyclase domain-containing protein [Xanthomonas hortorum pv. vitians]|uniref:diguanylate cyclase n=1 Tax=Xanthomonas hortorum pv. vitians TaxID=83224 RepID=A0A6V7EKU6_9XANT|nr:ligand-binding sensor domain-containing diguanylate cyclase [Xanthomonas hortorum]APP85345.1 GGDEF domain-containing protein [Xanthomonas hortorum pv. gardneri]ASW44729.1 histidine kinase [Xanthomonas hortorum]MCC8492436.1 diguanylate cyclase [Xanthomonas hortorum pv. gardneri]MCE4281845.1 diguanylate cyclase [Xanthomonas hortorum pv. vitians]MCE4284160.1 diguanylate cyclase [Xanthomonas hortorum pv. vitians]
MNHGVGACRTGQSTCAVRAPARGDRQWQRWLNAGACLLLALCAFAAAAAPAATAQLRDYAIDSWSSRNGLPHNSLRDIAQTHDGYLWFATWEGLVRYNGLEFSVIDRSTRPGLPDNGVGALYVDRDGALWLSDARGNLVRHSADGQWRRWERRGQWPQALIHAMTMDAQGRMWLLFEGHGLGCLWPDGRFEYFPPRDGVPLQSSFPRMLFDDQGRLLIGTLDGLIYRELDGHMHRAPAAFGLSPGLAWPYRAPDGTLWVVAGEQLYRLQGERAELVHRVPGQGHFTAMLQDRHGDLWLGSENQGLLRIGSHGVEHLPAGRSLPTGRIVSLREDAEGSIWVGANGGLFRLRETLFSSYSQRDGLSGDYARAVLEDRDGSLWIASTAGLDRMLPDGSIVPVPVATPSGRKLSVLSLALDRHGDLWVGTYADGVFVLRDGRVLRHYGEAEGIPSGHIRAIVIDDHAADHAVVWLATQRGVVKLVDGKRVALTIDGLPDGVVTALARIDGALWIGSVDGAAVLRNGKLQQLGLERLGGARSVFGFQSIGNAVWISTDRGLYRVRQGALARVGLEQGMPVDTVFQLVNDRLGNAWISSNRGVLRTELGTLDAVADGRGQLAVERYGEIDGMGNAQANGSSSPSMIARADGSVWVVTAGGISTVDPSRLQRFRERRAPPALIESVQQDGRPLAWRQQAKLPGGHRLNVSYVGMSFLLPERIEYRTRLEGLDNDWTERGRQRSVEFIGLPPGRYRLYVAARHPGGAWSPHEAMWAFEVLPLWWQRHDVRFAAVLAALLALALLYRLLLHRYKTHNARLAELVRKRTEDLQLQAQRLLQANQEKSELLTRLRIKSDVFERQAHEDALTGLPNRRHFDEALARDISRARRSGRSLVLAILDIDHFKRINDHYSHASGDAVLHEVGVLLIAAARASDLPARLGGEEFALLLADTSLEEAQALCLLIRALFHARQDWGGVDGLQVTFSAGVAELRDDDTGSSLMQRADHALYEAKSAGRDRICVG